MKDFCAIVPYRADAEGIRRRNAAIVLRWLTGGGVRTVVAEHSDTPDAEFTVPNHVARLHIPADGRPFSKAVACNAGFVHADVPVIALVDADTFTSMPAFLECVNAVREEFDVVRPFGQLVELDDEATVALAAGGGLSAGLVKSNDDDRGGEDIPLCGGIVILRSTTYQRAGGMDESFVGWGGEDDALSAALTRSKVKRAILESQVAFHLEHPRTLADRYLHPDYASNRARAIWWHEASDDQIAIAMRNGAAALDLRRQRLR